MATLAFFKKEHVSIPGEHFSHLQPKLAKEFALDAWFYPSASSATHASYHSILPRRQTIFHKGQTTSPDYLIAALREDGRLEVKVTLAPTVWVSSSKAPLATNRWYYLVIGFKENNGTIAVSTQLQTKGGETVATVVGGAEPTSVPLQEVFKRLFLESGPFIVGGYWNGRESPEKGPFSSSRTVIAPVLIQSPDLTDADLEIDPESSFVGFGNGVSGGSGSGSKQPEYPPDSHHYTPPVWRFVTMEELRDFSPDAHRATIEPPWTRPALPPRSRLLSCHDTRIGDEAMLQGGREFENFWNYEHWLSTDIFVYFTHERVSVPPPAFIRAAHANGTLILGTFNTEWDSGKRDNVLLLDGLNGDRYYYAKQFIALAKYWNLDGWFFNIESALPEGREVHYAERMAEFLRYLTYEIHKQLPNSLVLWYDSITTEGKIKYQNELNQLNKVFFDSCDGIFLNYNWNPERASNSAMTAGARKHDVYVGNDLWGRGTYKGGGFDTHQAIQVIKSFELSSALFAPTWTMYIAAKNSRDLFDYADSKLWFGKGYVDLMWRQFTDEETPWEIVPSKSNGFDFRIRAEAKFTEDKLVNTPGFGVNTAASSDAVLVCSYDWCLRKRVYNLRKLFPQWFDGSRSVVLNKVVASEWMTGTGPNTKDLFKLEVAALSEGSTPLARQAEYGTTDSQWKKYSSSVALGGSTSKQVQYIEWLDGGRDAEHWAGHFGPKLSNPSLIVEYSDPVAEKTEALVSFYPPRPAVTSLPFASNCSRGGGRCFYSNGVLASEENWTNLNEQSPRMALYKVDPRGVFGAVTYTESDAFDGGSSVKIPLRLERVDAVSQALQQGSSLARLNLVAISELHNVARIRCGLIVRGLTAGLQALVTFQSSIYTSVSEKSLDGGYAELVFELDHSAAETGVSWLGLAFGASQPLGDQFLLLDLFIGQLTLSDAAAGTRDVVASIFTAKSHRAAPLRSFNPKSIYATGPGAGGLHFDIKVSWSQVLASPSAGIRHFDLWLLGSQRKFLGRSFSPEYELQNLTQEVLQAYKIEIIAYGPLFNDCGHLELHLD